MVRESQIPKSKTKRIEITSLVCGRLTITQEYIKVESGGSTITFQSLCSILIDSNKYFTEIRLYCCPLLSKCDLWK